MNSRVGGIVTHMHKAGRSHAKFETVCLQRMPLHGEIARGAAA